MLAPIKKIIFVISFNLSLFFLLLVGIQNSSKQIKINLIIQETIYLPTSFIIGVSFISGSITGSLLKINFQNKKG